MKLNIFYIMDDDAIHAITCFIQITGQSVWPYTTTELP
jgi:hypothetical protein